MTWDQWLAILWLRWRLSVNQLHRAGTLSAIILTIVLVMAVVAGVSLLVVGLVAGISLLPKASAEQTLFVWDLIIAQFLFFWWIGLVTELQRSEMISLDRLLHLPLTLSGTFLLNYASSFVSLAMVLFLPGMLGLAIASVVAKGPHLLILFPLLFSFLLMVTALTYQLRGWLAALMVNKRRRRTVVAFVMAGTLLISLIPTNLTFMTLGRLWHEQNAADELEATIRAELNRALTAGEITPEEQLMRLAEPLAARVASERKSRHQNKENKARALRALNVANAVFPPGWLAYGAMSATDSQLGPALLAVLGNTLIGAASLWRAYRTTLRLYTGEFQGRTPVERLPASKEIQPASRTTPTGSPAKSSLLEWKLAGIPEPCAAIALANFRSLTRAPEVRMMLLTPLIMLAFFGVSSFNIKAPAVPEQFRPFLAFGALCLAMFWMLGLIQNQFGLDRSGFRAYVLSGTPRRDILLGKNLAVAPFGLGVGLLVLIVTQFLLPMRFSHLIASCLQLVSMFPLLCVVGNLSSILAPYAMSPGSQKPANLKGLTILWDVLFPMLLFPIVSTLGLIPLALEMLLQWLGWDVVVPVYFLLSLVELAVILFAYLQIVKWQGNLLSRRETRILELVTTKDE